MRRYTDEEKEIKREKKVKADLCFLKDDVWNIIELKAGGKLDSKKGPAERKNLDKLKLIISKKKNKKAEFFFATAYKSRTFPPSYFSKAELLLGEKFWEFICEDKLAYSFILNYFTEQMRIHKGKSDKNQLDWLVLYGNL